MTDISTNVTISGVTYDLNKMTPADNAKLYAALGKTGTKTNYQDMANQYTKFAQDYYLPVPLADLPPGVGPQEGFARVKQAIDKTTGELKKGSEPYLQSLKDQFEKIGILGHVKDTAETLKDGALFIPRVIDGMKRNYDNVGRLLDATGDSMHEFGSVVNGKFQPTSPQDAKNFGLWYAAQVYNSVDAPAVAGQPAKNEPKWYQSIGASIQATGSFLLNMLPDSFSGVKNFARTLYNFVANGLSGGGFNWSAAKTEAEQTTLAFQNGPKQGWSELYHAQLEHNVKESIVPTARANISEVLAQSGKIGNVDCQEFAKMVEKGGVYRTHEGVWNTLTIKDGKPVAAPLKDLDGHVLTSSQREKNRWKNVGDEAVSESGVGKVAQVMTWGAGTAWGVIGYSASHAWNAVFGGDDKKTDAKKDDSKNTASDEKKDEKKKETAALVKQDKGLEVAGVQYTQNAINAQNAAKTVGANMSSVQQVKVAGTGNAIPVLSNLPPVNVQQDVRSLS